MKLQYATWPEVETYLRRSTGIIVPVGSTEQHGPMGLIGTDALCAEDVAVAAAELSGAYVAPTLAYTPAPFNMAFAGTVSISTPLFRALVEEILAALRAHGFRHVYFLNGHGANLTPLGEVAAAADVAVRVRSWWQFEPVETLRRELYGDWEGMHATPSEVAMTQAAYRIVPATGSALTPPRKLSAEYIREHAGDRHGPPRRHRAQFPDGRVGSHSALATPQHGRRLRETAARAAAADYDRFVDARD